MGERAWFSHSLISRVTKTDVLPTLCQEKGSSVMRVAAICPSLTIIKIKKTSFSHFLRNFAGQSMYKIEWDTVTGGVLLRRGATPATLGIAPRPVFHEELDLIGLEAMGFTYERQEAPLLWAVNKQYFYRGQLLFTVAGADVYTMPTVTLAKGVTPGPLQAVDVEAMLSRNDALMAALESEAIEFIRQTFVTYSRATRTTERQGQDAVDYTALAQRAAKRQRRDMVVVREDCDSFDVMPTERAKAEGKTVLLATRIDRFIASFSGGKDSQVVLDLCTRAMPPTDFTVVYSDTGYELPPSLTLYDDVRRHYQARFPALRFLTARNHAPVLSYWDRIGTPSDTHRWCCSVMKTAPLYRLFKTDGNKQAHVLTFDGVRAEESTRRSTYARIGKGVKHGTVYNASPILYWSSVEIFLYLFRYKLPINEAYRHGMTRVGCVICPYSSEWNEMVANKIFPSVMQPFLSRIERNTIAAKVPDVKNYIAQGNWKRRAGGRDAKCTAAIDFKRKCNDIEIILKNPNKEPLLWISAVGKYFGDNKHGYLEYDKKAFPLTCKKGDDNTYKINVGSVESAPLLRGLLKRALYKATYCINCGACEVECPTGALTIVPNAEIDTSKCVHCGKCLLFHETGCIVAHSLRITDAKDNNMKLISYNNFGLRDEWLEYFMANQDNYFETTDHGLNVKEQLPSFVKWLVHAGILTDTKTRKITTLGQALAVIANDDPATVWQVIWTNLAHNSPIARWYANKVTFGSTFTEAEIRERVKEDYPSDSPTTIKNIVYALFRTFRESPIGKDMEQLSNVDKLTFTRVAYDDVTLPAIAYSIYRYAEDKEMRMLRVSDFYAENAENGIYKEFGISKQEFYKKLRTLSSDANRVLIAELNMGLEHITLRDDLTATSALDILTK